MKTFKQLQEVKQEGIFGMIDHKAMANALTHDDIAKIVAHRHLMETKKEFKAMRAWPLNHQSLAMEADRSFNHGGLRNDISNHIWKIAKQHVKD